MPSKKRQYLCPTEPDHGLMRPPLYHQARERLAQLHCPSEDPRTAADFLGIKIG